MACENVGQNIVDHFIDVNKKVELGSGALREELADEVVVAKFANTTQHGAIEGKQQIKVLDVITTANTYKPTARLCRFHKGFVRPTERMSKKCQLKNGKTLL